MIAQTELEIVWDGPVRGLQFHRISLATFGEALDLLMKAAHRIASQKLTEALEPALTGRLAASAKNLDIEITGVKSASSGFSSVITFEVPDSAQAVLFNQLPEIVGIELLEGIDAEAKGQYRNAAIRKFLNALPKELDRQSYTLHQGGRTIRKVELSTLTLPSKEEPLPIFISVDGRISGVGFEPGRWEVKVRGKDNQVVASATEAQVNQALDLRSHEVRCLAVSSPEGTRLVNLESASVPVGRPSLNELFDQWDETYRALA